LKIAYVIPGPMHLTELGEAEISRRKQKLQGWAFPGTEVDALSVDRGPASIESAYEEYLTVEPVAQKLRAAEDEGYDASILGCFGDPGLDGLREISAKPVIGPAGASMSLAATLGHRFGIVTVTESIVHALRRLAWETGVLDALASVRFIDTPVLELNRSRDEAIARMVAEGKKSVEDGADTLVLGCMSMGFLDVAEEMSEGLGIPVINPAKAGLKHAESLVSMGLSQSRKAYFTTPKIESGKHLEGLLVAP